MASGSMIAVAGHCLPELGRIRLPALIGLKSAVLGFVSKLGSFFPRALFQKRLFAQTFDCFLATKDGLKVFYKLVETMKNDGNSPKTKRPSELSSDGLLKIQSGLLSKFPFFLSASVRTMGNMVGPRAFVSNFLSREPRF